MANGQNPFKRQGQPPGNPPKGDAPYYPTKEEMEAASQRPLGTPSPWSRQNRRKWDAERKLQQQKAAEQREINRVNARQDKANADALADAKAQFIRQQGVDPKDVDRIDVDPQGGLRMLLKRKFLRHEIDKDTGETQAIFRNKNNQEERHNVLNKAGKPIKDAGLKLDRSTGHQYVDIEGTRHIVRKNLALKEYYDYKAKENKARREEQDALDVQGDLEESLDRANTEIKATEKWLSDIAKRKQKPGDIELVDEKKKELEALTKDRDRIYEQHKGATTDYRKKRSAHSRLEDNPVQYRTAIDFPRYSAIAPPSDGEDEETVGARGSLGIQGDAYESEDPPIQVEGTSLKVDPYEGYYKSEITIPGGYTQHFYIPKMAGKKMAHTAKDRVSYNKVVKEELRKGTPAREAHNKALKKYPMTLTGKDGRKAELERLENEYAKLEKEWEEFTRKTDPATGVPEQAQSSIQQAQEIQGRLNQVKEELDAARRMASSRPALAARAGLPAGTLTDPRIRLHAIGEAARSETSAVDKAIAIRKRLIEAIDISDSEGKQRLKNLQDGLRSLEARKESIATTLNADIYKRLGPVDGATLSVPIQTKYDAINALKADEGEKKDLKNQAEAHEYTMIVREMSAGVDNHPGRREALLHLLKGYRGADPNVLNNKALKDIGKSGLPWNEKRSNLEYALEKLSGTGALKHVDQDLNKQELIAIGHHLSRLGVKGVPEVVMRREFEEISQEALEDFGNKRGNELWPSTGGLVLEDGEWKQRRKDVGGLYLPLSPMRSVEWQGELALKKAESHRPPVIEPNSAEELASWVQENIIPFRHVFKSGHQKWAEANRTTFEDEGTAWKKIVYDKESNAGYYFRYKPQSKGQVMQFKVDQELGDVTNPGKVIDWTIPKGVHKAPGQLGEKMLSHVSENLGVAAPWMSMETLKSATSRFARDTIKVVNSMGYGASLTAAKVWGDPGAMEAVMAVQRKNDEQLDEALPVSVRDSFKAISDEAMQWRHGMSAAGSQILVTALMAPVGAGVTIGRTGLITMPKTLGRWGGFGAGVLPNFSYQLKGGMEDAMAHGVSAEKAFNKAAGTAAIISPVDTLSDFMLLGGGKVVKKLVPQAAIRRTQADLLKSIGLAGGVFAAKAAVEGETERLQTYIENWNAKHWSGYDKDRWIHEGTGMAAAIGYGFGAIMSAPSTAFQAIEARKRAKKFIEIEEAVEEVQKAAQGGTAAKRAYNEKVGGEVFTDIDFYDQVQALKERRAGLPMELLGVDADTLAPILVDSGLSPEAQDSVIEMIAEGDIAALAALAISGKISAPSAKRSKEIDKVLADTGEVTRVRSGTAQGIVEGSIFLAREVESILNTGSATNEEAAGILVEIGVALEQANGQLKINSKASQVLPSIIAGKVVEEANKAAQGAPTFAEPSPEVADPRVEDLINEGRDNLKNAAEEIVNAPLPESWNVTLQDPNNPDQSFPIVVQASSPEAAQEMANNMVAPGGVFPGHAIQSIDLIEQDERDNIERDAAQQQDQEMGLPQEEPLVQEEAQVPQAELEEAPAASPQELLEGVGTAVQEFARANEAMLGRHGIRVVLDGQVLGLRAAPFIKPETGRPAYINHQVLEEGGDPEVLIYLNSEGIARGLEQYPEGRGQAEVLQKVVGEELIHALDYASMRDKWINGGRQGTFEEFIEAENRSVWDEMTDEERLAAATPYVADPAGLRLTDNGVITASGTELSIDQVVSEYVRQLVQTEREGASSELILLQKKGFGEAVRERLQSIFDYLRSALATATKELRPLLRERMDVIQGLLTGVTEITREETAPAPGAQAAPRGRAAEPVDPGGEGRPEMGRRAGAPEAAPGDRAEGVLGDMGLPREQALALEAFNIGLAEKGLPPATNATLDPPPGLETFVAGWDAIGTGRRIVFVDMPMNASGAVQPGHNVIFINRLSEARLDVATVGHEFVHTLKESSPELYDDLLTTIRKLAKTRALRLPDYIEEAYKGIGVTDIAQLEEEALANLVGDLFLEKKFWKILAKKEKGLFRKIYSKFIEYVSDAARLFTMHWGQAGFGQIEEMQLQGRALTKAHNALADVMLASRGAKAALKRGGIKFALDDFGQESFSKNWPLPSNWPTPPGQLRAMLKGKFSTLIDQGGVDSLLNALSEEHIKSGLPVRDFFEFAATILDEMGEHGESRTVREEIANPRFNAKAKRIDQRIETDHARRLLQVVRRQVAAMTNKRTPDRVNRDDLPWVRALLTRKDLPEVPSNPYDSMRAEEYQQLRDKLIAVGANEELSKAAEAAPSNVRSLEAYARFVIRNYVRTVHQKNLQEDQGNTRFALDVDDTRYMDLARDPKKNRAELQQMVDARAKAAGYDVGPVFHGAVEEFSVFRTRPDQKKSFSGIGETSLGAMFSESKEIAGSYPLHNRNNRLRKTLPVYLRLGSLKKFQSLSDVREDMMQFNASKGGPEIPAPQSRIASSQKYQDHLKSQGFDGITFSEGKARQPNNARKIVYAVFDPSQIKSADPVTYDDQGNVIPLSQRFDPAKKDTRFALDVPIEGGQTILPDGDRTMIPGTVFFAGGGLVEVGLPWVNWGVVVEYDPELAAVHKKAHGSNPTVQDVREFVNSSKNLNRIPKNGYFHASPVCKDFSVINQNVAESDLPVITAKAVAKVIRERTPAIFTLENVKQYAFPPKKKGKPQPTEALDIITKALDEGGYAWQGQVYDAADFGAPTHRNRYLLRATRHGELPPVPQPTHGPTTDTPHVGWYDLVEDLIEDLPDMSLESLRRAKYIYRSFEKHEGGIDPENVPEPILVAGSAVHYKVNTARPNEPMFTILADSNDILRILLPGGRVKKVTSRVKARLTGLPDSYPLPSDSIATGADAKWTQEEKNSERTSKIIVGNGVPPALAAGVFGPLIQQEIARRGETPRFALDVDDTRYMELAKDPKKNRVELQRMVDARARAASGIQFIDAGKEQSQALANQKEFDSTRNYYEQKLSTELTKEKEAEAIANAKPNQKRWADEGLDYEDPASFLKGLRMGLKAPSSEESIKAEYATERRSAKRELEKAENLYKRRGGKQQTTTDFKTGVPFYTKVSHATPFGRIESFDPDRLGVYTGAPSAGKAFFFAGSKDVAESYFADDAIYLPHKGFLALTSEQQVELVDALRAERMSVDEWSDSEVQDEAHELFSDEELEHYDITPFENVRHDVFVTLHNPLVVDQEGAYREESYFDALVRAEEGGHDGVVFANTTDSGPAKPFGAWDIPTNVIAVLAKEEATHQIKSADPVTYDDQGNVIPLSQRFDPAKKDIRFALDVDDTRYMELVKNVEYLRARVADPDTYYRNEDGFGSRDNDDYVADNLEEELQRMVDAAAKEAGYNIGPVFHGTTHDFNVFLRDRGNAAGDYGLGYYLTSSREDAEINYAGEGADLTARIELLAERYNLDELSEEEVAEFAEERGIDLESIRGEDLDSKLEELATQAAIRELSGGKERLITAYVRLKNPAVIGGRFDDLVSLEPYDYYNEEAMEEYRPEAERLVMEEEGIDKGELKNYQEEVREKQEQWAGETGNFNDEPHPLLEAVDRVSQDFIYVNQDKVERLRELVFEEPYLHEVDEILRDVFDQAVEEDTGNDMATGEAVRRVYEELGYDGIVDKTVNKKFGELRRFGRPMGGIGRDDYHVIAFDSSQIKSADPATYDDQGNVIPLSQRFDPAKKDIRFALDVEIEDRYDKLAENPDANREEMQNIVDDVSKKAEEDYYRKKESFLKNLEKEANRVAEKNEREAESTLDKFDDDADKSLDRFFDEATWEKSTEDEGTEFEQTSWTFNPKLNGILSGGQFYFKHGDPRIFKSKDSKVYDWGFENWENSLEGAKEAVENEWREQAEEIIKRERELAYQPDLPAADERNFPIIPDAGGIKIINSRSTNSIYFEGEDGDGYPFKFSIRDHAPSVSREAQFGQVNEYWTVDWADAKSIYEAYEQLIQEIEANSNLGKKYPYYRDDAEFLIDRFGRRPEIRFALDVDEGAKLSAIKDPTAFSEALDRAPRNAILGAYPSMLSGDWDPGNINSLAEKVEEILTPDSAPDHHQGKAVLDMQTSAAQAVAGVIRGKEDIETYRQVVQLRDMIDNWESHPSIKARVDDLSYDQAAMSVIPAAKRTKRQQNFINVWERHKSKPNSAYAKAAAKALEKDFGADWKQIIEKGEVTVVNPGKATRFALDVDDTRYIEWDKGEAYDKYMELAKDPEANREELEAIVNKRARRRLAQGGERFIHTSTGRKGFTEFKVPAWFEPARQPLYRDEILPQQEDYDPADHETREFYLDVWNPKIVSHTTIMSQPYSNADPNATPLTEEDIQVAKEHNLEHDADSPFDGWFSPETGQYVITQPSQAKSTDAVTRHRGRIVPLDERMEGRKKDTRFALDVEKDFPMSSLNLLHGAEKHPKTRKLEAAGTALQNLALKKWGRIITSLDITEEEKQEIVDNGVEEFLAALEASGKNAADWYSVAIEVAMEVASLIHPELNNAEAARKSKGFANAEDPVKAANLVMRIALATTSQNLNVAENAKYAEEQFEIFAKTGKFDGIRGEKYGEKGQAIGGNLDLANKLIEKVGFEEAERFIRQSMTVRELEDTVKQTLGITKTIEGKKDDLVNGAAIFGPKIGQGFLQNLMAVFDPVTIDLWLRRTWGRWTGNVMGVAFNEERTAGLIQAVRIAKNPEIKLPESWRGIRLIKGKRGTGAEYDTVSEELIDKIEANPDFRDEMLTSIRKWTSLWNAQYKLVSFSRPKKTENAPNGRPVTEESKRLIDALKQPKRVKAKSLTKEQKIARGKVWDKIYKSQQKMEDEANDAWDNLSKEEKAIAKEEWPTQTKGHWRDNYFRENGHKVDLEATDIGKIKPEWAYSVNQINANASTIDIPAAADRRVITEIINRIGDRVRELGYETTNADIQAILWYPEKDLWAKMSGKDESNLKSSYDEEFKRIAIDKKYDKAKVERVAEKAEREARENRASRTGGKPDRGATRQVRGRPDKADGQKAKRAGKTRFALDVDPPQFSLDPGQSAEIYRVKRQALEDARNKRSTIQKATKSLEKAARTAVQEPGYLIRKGIQGKYDLMDTMSARQGGSGEAGQALRRGELNQSLGESAINQYAQRLSRELKNLLGISAWRFIARKKRLNKFSRDLHTVAARLNAVAYNPDGSFAFEGFDQRVGFMEENEAHAMGLGDGGYVNIQKRVLQLQWNQDKEGYILLERYTAEEQQMFYNEFMQEYPDLGIFLNRWIAPGMENARHVGPQGVETPVFNRYSLHNFYSGTVYGDPGQLPGYTPDVVQRTIIGGMLWGIARAATGKLPGKRFGFLAGKKSSARTVKTGAAREQGFSMDMIKGFNVRAMEAHMEDIRRNQALDLIRSATKPVPANNVVPEHHIRVDKVAMNQLLRGLVETLGKKSAEGLALNELWNKAVENKDPSHVLLDESQRKFSQREKAIVEFLFGDERAIDLLGSDRMMDRVNWEQLTNNMADRAYNNWWLGLLAQQVGEYTATLLVGPATIAFNWLAPQIQAITAGMHRLLRSFFYAASLKRENWNRAEIELRAGLETLLGLLTRRVTGWEGINMFLPGADKVRGSLTQEDHAKGTLGLIKEGQVGKAIKRATDRHRAYGEFVPRELFDDTALMTALQAGETGTDSVLQNLMNLKPGTAILQAVKFSEMDTTVKQNLVYSAYKAHAAVAARKAKVPKTQRKAWIQDYMRRISKENPNIHKEAFDTAMLFAFDYSNVPLLFSAKDKSQGGKILLRGLAMFSGFIYNYAKLLYTLSPVGWGTKMAKPIIGKGKKDALGGSEARNAMASAAMFAMGMMLFSEDDEPEDEDEETKRKKRYAPNLFGTSWTKWGDEIEAWWTATGGKISIDALDEMFGTSVANSIRAYLEANGASDAEGMEIWLRGRSLPYVQYMGAFATLGQTIQGKREAPQALGEIGEMVGDFLPSGPLQTIFGVENKYNRSTPHLYRVADIGYDLVSSRLIPPPLRKAATSYVDPVMRRKSPSESLGTDYTLLDHIKRSTPGLSTQIPPAATVNSFKLKPGQEMTEAQAADIAKLMEMDLQPETVLSKTVDEFGNTTIAYVDPDQIKIKSKGEWYLHFFARTQGIDKVERVLAYYDLTKEEIEKIEAKNEENKKRIDRGQTVAEKYMLTEKERIQLKSWQAYKEGKDFALLMEQYMERDEAILPDLINPSTRQIGEGGEEKQLRPNWSNAEYNKLLRAVVKRQPRNTFGKMIDPNTGNELDMDTPRAIDLGHISGRAWKDIANDPKYRGLTPKEIAKLELNPEYYVLEESWHNRKMGKESARKAIYKKELPEGALKP